MLTIALIGLLGGLITGVSPCILPVLPVVLLAGGVGAGGVGADGVAAAGAVTGDAAGSRSRRRAYAVIAGLVASFSVFTLVGTVLLGALGLPATLPRTIGVVLLVLVGLGLVVPPLERLVERPFAALPQRLPRPGHRGGGLLLGFGLGLLYVPCAGPVLTAITFAGATGAITVTTAVLTLAFAVGAALPLLGFALAGGRIGQRLAAYRRRQRLVRVTAGVLMIGFALALGFDLAASVQRAIPDYTAGLQKRLAASPAASPVVKPALSGLDDDRNRELSRCEDAAPELRDCGLAPELDRVTAWLNTPGGTPVRMAQLRGRVVLIDFWTYSCVNCQRSLPHVQAWDRAYRDLGLTVIGVHTPEFGFERDLDNVRAGAARLGVRHAVAVDNAYAMFTAYRNQYWPAQFLVDATGRVRYFKLGEGSYEVTERHIRELLTAASPGAVLPPPTDVPDRTVTDPRTTPETYLGAAKIRGYLGEPLAVGRPTTYRFPAAFPVDTVGLHGTWTAGAESLVAGPDARIGLHYRARAVYLVVAGSGTVTADPGGTGARQLPVSGTPMLYPLVEPGELRDAQLTVALTPGLSAYVFTFG